MKKVISIFLTSLFATLLIVGGAKAIQAWQLGSFSERAKMSVKAGIVAQLSDYQGNLSQNLALLGVYNTKADESINLGVYSAPSVASQPLPQDGYDTYITRALGATDTTIYVNEHPDIIPTVFTLFQTDGRTISEKVYCTATSTSGTSLTLTGCGRGISLIPVQGTIDENVGTGSSHPKNTRFAITDNINFSGKAISIFNGAQVTGGDMFRIGDGNGSGNQVLYFQPATSTLATRALIYYDGTTLGWSVDNGSNTFAFNDAGTVLAASTTKGIFITDSKVGINVAPTAGLKFFNGKLGVELGTGLATSSNALIVDTASNLAFTGTLSTTKTFSAATTTVTNFTSTGTTTLASLKTFIGATSTNALVNGGDADALHQHDYAGVGDWHSKLYYNFNLPWISGLWTATTLTPNYAGSYVSLNISAGSIVTARPIFLRADGGRLDWSKKIILEWAAAKTGTATGKGHMGLASNGGATAYQDVTTSDRVTFGFTPSNELFAQAGDGTNITNATITAVTLTNMNTYRIEYTPNSNTKYYVNGVLRATISTTQPRYAVTTNYPFFGIGTNNSAHFIGTSTSPYFAVGK